MAVFREVREAPLPCRLTLDRDLHSSFPAADTARRWRSVAGRLRTWTAQSDALSRVGQRGSPPSPGDGLPVPASGNPFLASLSVRLWIGGTGAVWETRHHGRLTRWSGPDGGCWHRGLLRIRSRSPLSQEMSPGVHGASVPCAPHRLPSASGHLCLNPCMELPALRLRTCPDTGPWWRGLSGRHGTDMPSETVHSTSPRGIASGKRQNALLASSAAWTPAAPLLS